jgi:hypothetical protein
MLLLALLSGRTMLNIAFVVVLLCATVLLLKEFGKGSRGRRL